MATYNKNGCLPNTLYSLARQKTSFPVEICIVDDKSEIEPKDIIFKFIPDCKYKRLEERAGEYLSLGKCLDLVSKDTDVIVLQSCDVLYAQDNILEVLCTAVGPKVFTMPEVRDLKVDPDMYLNFNQKIKYLISEKAIDDRRKYGGNHIFYAGSRQPNPNKRWYFFLGAIRKDDLFATNIKNNAYDRLIAAEMHKLGYSPKYFDELIGIHQSHKIIKYGGGNPK
jgi:hypothetical protein